ncbi:dTDP-4-dehydrorhamnose reductase family protein [Paenibacillus sp. NPDC056722]|uniref:dTDP-4-dehydrorhamnose reductase family protein n=1 Tax=Paenibacillus sp. NPDC056722 TaxID=3345924 RepID=UPI0036B7AD8E
MRTLVLGAGGMAGHLVTLFLSEKGHSVTGFARNDLPFCDTFIGDALNKDHLKAAMNCDSFDAVINCVGVLNKDVDAHLTSGIFLNSYLPHFLAEYLEGTDTKLIHLSTDCVFSGRTGGYTESSFKDADSFYGRTKSLGEVDDSSNLTIRTSIIGPDIKEQGTGLLNWFLSQRGSVQGFTSAIWTGVSTVTLAHAIEYALEKELNGVYHLVNNETISKFKLLCLFNRYLKNGEIEVIMNDTLYVDKSLINTREDFDFKVPSYEQMIIDTKEWMVAHQELYPHYF